MQAANPDPSPAWAWLLRDIGACCQRCEAAVDTRKDPELVPHQRRAMAKLAELRDAVEEAQDEEVDDDIGLAMLATIGREFEIFRRTHLSFFAHYDADARYLTLLARQLAEEAGFPIRTPILGTFSNAGYWTDPTLSTICLPAGDHDQLLSFPDLVHEFGHLLMGEAEGGLTSRFLGESIGPYVERLDPIEGEPEYGERLYAQYQEWLGELVADVVATYVCGPSYGWQNLRLCAQGSPATEFWHPAAPAASDEGALPFGHPADLARTDVIAAVLQSTGHETDGVHLQAKWNGLIAHAGRPPKSYAVTYPANVLDDLAAMALEWCRESGLTPFAETGSTSVVSYIDRAWRDQLATTGPSAKDEAERVAELRANVLATA